MFCNIYTITWLGHHFYPFLPQPYPTTLPFIFFQSLYHLLPITFTHFFLRLCHLPNQPPQFEVLKQYQFFFFKINCSNIVIILGSTKHMQNACIQKAKHLLLVILSLCSGYLCIGYIYYESYALLLK